MERRKTIQEHITTGIQQSRLPNWPVASDLAARSNLSALHRDRRLLSSNLYSSNKHIGPSSVIERKFSDPEFLPIPESITKDYGGTGFNDLEYGANVARWVRPEQIRWSKEAQQYPLTVFNQPRSRDIIQGCLGNCWLISALSLIAEKPYILYKVMITKQYNPAGLYQIRLCNRGIWQVITIDDMLPVTEANTFVFTRSQKKQLFASLIEKALAKMHGSYKALEYDTGRVAIVPCAESSSSTNYYTNTVCVGNTPTRRCVEGLQTLTGKSCEVFLLNSTDPKKKPNLNHIWIKIIQSRAKGYLMTCLSTNTPLNEGFFNQKGLELEHAYSILDARQVGSQRLVRLRNPWGKKEQNGTLNDTWNKWSGTPQEKSLTSAENDGVFWMPWEEMSSLFSDITVCKIGANDHEVRRRGQFSDFSSKITSAYTLDCPHGAELDIELFNAGDERYKNHSKSPDIDLFLIVLSSNGSCNAYKHSVDYYITLSTVVPPGQYIILAGSMSVVNYSIHSKFNLVVHATQPFVLNQRPSSPELVGNAFHAVALQANNRKDFGDGVSILSFNDNGGFGFVCENKCNRTIRLTTDFQGSLNVFSSRKTFHMVDLIPAKTKQLFAIFTRKMPTDNVHIVYQAEYQSVNEPHGATHIRVRNDPPIPPEALGLHISKPVR